MSICILVFTRFGLKVTLSRILMSCLVKSMGKFVRTVSINYLIFLFISVQYHYCHRRTSSSASSSSSSSSSFPPPFPPPPPHHCHHHCHLHYLFISFLHLCVYIIKIRFVNQWLFTLSLHFLMYVFFFSPIWLFGLVSNRKVLVVCGRNEVTKNCFIL